ncbi:MAG: bifunctional oligoribonuclease/PAP phosphatase NrnA [Acidobacteria bacterium]|nr:bifunctional oligoribonuclease/PAP phosphatase NrnA [Acidobacteriota bacterium]MCB9378028.1 bifunctional oligoribonuclease/PAP phosphatase NrnA [Holophagales bacterium]
MIAQKLVARLRAGSRFLVTSHIHPDGDAIGSELGLARVLASIGKSTRIWNRDAAPAIYAPLPGSDRIVVGEEPPAGYPESFDAAIVLECPSLDRTGLAEALGALPLINIDHHLGNQHYGELNWVDPEAPAVGVMVHELATALGVHLESHAADCLYLALVTDTGGFRFGNATPRAFEAAARLVAAGASVERVSHWLYESQPEAAVRLLGELLATLERHGDGRVATVALPRAAFERAGAAAGDSEGLIDVPRSIAGVEAVALLRELGDDDWKLSLRSRGAVDVEAVARRHGGGGHKNAAGGRARGSLADVREAIAAELAGAVGSPDGG